MSIDEIYDMIDSFNRTTIQRKKEEAINNQILADQVIRGLCLIFNGSESEIKPLNLWDYYPELFNKEKDQYIQKQEDDEFEEFKTRRKEFMNRHNKLYKGDGD